MTTMKWFGQREETGEPDFYEYDDISDELRGKIRFTVLDCLDRVMGLSILSGGNAERVVYYHGIELISRALGHELGNGYRPRDDLDTFLQSADRISLFRGIEALLQHLLRLWSVTRDDTVLEEQIRLQKELNKLFGQYRLGYRIEVLNSPREDEPPLQIIRVDSEFTHKEMVQPTLRVLQQEGFETASHQFSEALAEYTDGHYGNAITDANSAFESVLKRVLNRKAGTAHQLIRLAAKEGYFPTYLQNSAVEFTKLLEALPIVRDQESDAHGSLTDQSEPETLARFARYAIHLAAANIIFIMDEYNRRKSAQ